VFPEKFVSVSAVIESLVTINDEQANLIQQLFSFIFQDNSKSAIEKVPEDNLLHQFQTAWANSRNFCVWPECKAFQTLTSVLVSLLTRSEVD
jgi:hypothetical protein